MSGQLAALLGCLVVSLNLVGSLRFRAGKTPLLASGGRDALIRRYRNPNSPLLWRMVPLLGPLLSAGSLPVLAVLALWPLLDVTPSPLPPRVDVALLFGSAGLAALSLGAAAAIAYRRPRWLVPAWLAEDDRRVGHVPLPPDRLDLVSALFVGALGLGGGVLVLAAGVVLELR